MSDHLNNATWEAMTTRNHQNPQNHQNYRNPPNQPNQTNQRNQPHHPHHPNQQNKQNQQTKFGEITSKQSRTSYRDEMGGFENMNNNKQYNHHEPRLTAHSSSEEDLKLAKIQGKKDKKLKKKENEFCSRALDAYFK